MTQANERSATLSEMVAEEIRVLMTRRKVSGRELAAQLEVSPSWISYRLSGKQPIDVNDMQRIANALGVGVHQLLPPPESAAEAVYRPIPRYLDMAERPPAQMTRPPDNRPGRRGKAGAGAGVGRTAYLDRGGLRRRDR